MGSLGDVERARWRKKAVAWLQADLARKAEALEPGDEQAPVDLKGKLAWWKKDHDLAGIRDKAQIAKLSEQEGEACRALWSAVDEILNRIEQKLAANPDPQK